MISQTGYLYGGRRFYDIVLLVLLKEGDWEIFSTKQGLGACLDLVEWFGVLELGMNWLFCVRLNTESLAPSRPFFVS